MMIDNSILKRDDANCARVRIMANIHFEAAGRFKVLSAETEFMRSQLPAWVLELGLQRGEIIPV
jgi:hypothetical protein